jgi:acetyltransferase
MEGRYPRNGGPFRPWCGTGMSSYGFEHILSPASIAVVGASEREGALGGIALRALQAGGFRGALHAVNPGRASVHGVACHPSIGAIGSPVDLVLVATPPAAVAAVIDDAIAHGVRAAIVITAGLGRGEGSVAATILAKAREAGLRLVGPNCLGVLSPRAAMNASFARALPRPGPVALISQSGAIAAGLIAWGAPRGIGFSGVISLGDAIDVDMGDCLDHFAEDPATRVIVLYAEGLADARKFMAAARKAARVKPVIALKAGRHGEGARAAATHTGALAGSDAVYDAAFRRAGLIRVTDTDELYATLEALAPGLAAGGDRLAIVTNGGGLGVLAVDRLVDHGGRLASLSDPTIAALDGALPATWSRANPVDIIGDAPPERYRAAMEAVLADDGVDAVLVMNCPTAVASAEAAAGAAAEAVTRLRAEGLPPKPVAAMWMGADEAVRDIFRAAGIPHFATESDAVLGLTQLFRLKAGTDRLLLPPTPLPAAIEPRREEAASAIRQALSDGRDWLDPLEVKALLDAYGIAAADARLARDAQESAAIAAEMLRSAKALAVKIHSVDITHKSDVDGVRLGLATPEAVAAEAAAILERAARLRPAARIAGVTLHPMIETLQARELIVGMAVDPTFGPVLLFGHGGTAVEVIADKALALLPVDLDQARKLIGETRVARLLAGYRNVPPADREALALLLVRVSRLVEDNPEIVGLDLNPVLSDADRTIALDARVQVAAVADPDRARAAGRRFAVRPYPRQLERIVPVEGGGRIAVRPLRPTDGAALAELLEACREDALASFLPEPAARLGPATVARLTQLDYAREMAFVTLAPDGRRFTGAARLRGDADGQAAAFRLLVRPDQAETGPVQTLLDSLVDFARSEGYGRLEGRLPAGSVGSPSLWTARGFTLSADAAGTLARLSLPAA